MGKTEKKINDLNTLAKYRTEVLYSKPELRYLFLELTNKCNEACLHCGSKCGQASFSEGKEPTVDEYKDLLKQVKEDFDLSKLRLCVTGGEPLLREDFFDIMKYANELGFMWGMTSNGTLIDSEVAKKLAQCGMKTISISLDGLKDSHDYFRQSAGSYERTMKGIEALLKTEGIKTVQITSVIHRRNIDELNELYELVKRKGVPSWRVINIEPIGRALEYPELLLSADDLRYLMDFIKEIREKDGPDVTYGCSHYLGPEYEREVRKWYFLCSAGLYTASITHTGDMVACLDLPRRPEIVQGNIRTDRLTDVWNGKYEMFRMDFRRTGKCASCEHYDFCAGDAFHSWDFDRMEPIICMKGVLF